MNILHVISNVLNTSLGKRTRFETIIEKSSHKHFVLSNPENSSNEGGSEYGNNWEMHNLKTLQFTRHIKRGSFYLSMPLLFLEVLNVAIKEKISIIHSHNTGSMGYVSFNVARFLGKPYVFEFHGLQIGSHGDGTKLSLIRKRELSIERMLSCKADNVVVQTPKMAKSLVGAYHIPEERVTVLENVIDTDFFNPSHYVNCRSKYREKWSLGADDILFLYAGYFDEINGILELMEAFSKLPLDSKACLIIAGDGPLVEDVINMNNKTSSHVKYIGKIDKKEMPAVYAATDVLMLVRPDRHETREATPMKLMEAMAMEKLVVCSNVEGLTRVCDEDSGIIIEPGNVEDLKRTITLVENNYGSFQNRRKNARSRIMSHFADKNESNIIDELYVSLVKNRNKK